MALQIRKATRRKAKLRLALLGPSGSGKTMSALRLAMGIGGKTIIIDSENGSADLYADIGDYDVITLEKPYTTEKYREAIAMAEDAGYDTIIIDSLTHAWAGSGGLLEKQRQMERSGRVKNSYQAWGDLTPEQNAFVEAMLTSPCHIIATMRVKTEYVLEANERGKMVPVKKGMQPVQRDGLEYEFTAVLDVDADHKATASKDRTKLFNGFYDTLTERTGKQVLAWLEAGEDAPVTVREPEPAPAPEPPKKTIRDIVREKLATCTTEDEVSAVAELPKVKEAFERAPDDIKEELGQMLTDAMERVLEAAETKQIAAE